MENLWIFVILLPANENIRNLTEDTVSYSSSSTVNKYLKSKQLQRKLQNS